jgi:hypothetical protein
MQIAASRVPPDHRSSGDAVNFGNDLMTLTTTDADAEERSCVAMTHLDLILEWVGVVGFMGFVIVGMALACALYPLILCAQWASRRTAWTVRR